MEQFLPEFVYGSIDGTITTFAIVAGAIGAGLGRNAVLAIGIASVFADGYSMGVSSYLSESARYDQQKHRPPEERTAHTPITSGLVTFLSFVSVGILPLIPFLLTPKVTDAVKRISLLIALVAFATIGYLRGFITNVVSPLQTSVESLLIGGSAALISYYTGTAFA